MLTMKRSSGILMPVYALPSPHGIGTFGRAAYDFADFLHAAGQSYWQMLPLGPTSYGDSPYQSFSTYAGNPYFIDLDELEADGLLTAFNEKNGNTGAGTINGGVYLMKRALLDEIPEGKVSLENECIPRWMQEGRRLGGIVNDGYFIDIGVPEDYFRFQENVRKGDITW